MKIHIGTYARKSQFYYYIALYYFGNNKLFERPKMDAVSCLIPTFSMVNISHTNGIFLREEFFENSRKLRCLFFVLQKANSIRIQYIIFELRGRSQTT